jgi:hypothetical protein
MATHRLVPAVLLAALAAFACGTAPAEAGPRARDAQLLHLLKSRRLGQVTFQEATLEEVVRWMRIATGQNVVIRHAPIAKAGIDLDAVRITLTLEDVTPWQVLRLVLEPHGLAATVDGNVLWITSHKDSLGRPVTRLYAISHITYQKRDFIAPDINLRPSDFVPAEEYEPEVIDERDPLTSGDAVADLLRDLVRPGEWDEEGWLLRATDRYLVVRCPASVHVEVERALVTIAALK